MPGAFARRPPRHSHARSAPAEAGLPQRGGKHHGNKHDRPDPYGFGHIVSSHDEPAVFHQAKAYREREQEIEHRRSDARAHSKATIVPVSEK